MIATDVRTDAPSKERWPGLGEHDRIVAVVALLLIVAFAPIQVRVKGHHINICTLGDRNESIRIQRATEHVHRPEGGW